MSNIKKFIGEYAYKHIENMAYSADEIRSALVTPQNARELFSELSEFETKSFVADVSNSGTIGTVRSTTQEEIKSAFAESGYTTVIFDDEIAIAECERYYSSGERICTYNNLKGRMQEYYMLVAIKGDIDKIKRSEYPQRDDEYGTSILNIQIARNGSHMSIKNRYNHTVGQCDATFNNDLNRVTMGLQNMVLGYYGFAGISKGNNKQYDNIVKIGGIYLKYHTEINNLYFGNFVLDGVNGARYINSSRYYITKCAKDRHGNLPMVLDFQNKVAIDLVGTNRKTPLISRAMQDGMLHSGNKEQAEEMCTVFMEAKKELLQTNNKALKYIAESYGYDFQQPHKIVGILGKFTANSIEKITGDANALLLIVNDDDMRVAKLNRGRFEVDSLKSMYGISTFYTKGHFEEVRKSGYAGVYLIQQDKKHHRMIEDNSFGRARFYVNNKMRYIDEMSESEIARMKLSERLRDYKTNKRKSESEAIDYTKDILAIDKEFMTFKKEVILRLTNATTYEEYDRVSSATNYKLPNLVRDIARFKRNATNKNFTSIKQAQDSMDNIKAIITELRENLNKDQSMVTELNKV